MFSLLRGPRPAPDAPDRPLDRQRILVIEDEEVMQRFYSCFFDKLHKEEFSWRLARDGNEALKALETDPPDIVLLDWLLPAVPGQAVLKAIRAHPKTRKLGILVVTSKSAPHDVVLALESGADDYLSKPFEERVLLARLHSLVRRHQALRTVEAQLRQAQKLETLGLLAGGIVHDFNNMLTIVKGFAGFLTKSLKPGTVQMEDAEEILRAVDRASSLTRQLLTFSHKQPSEPAPCDLNQVVRDMAQMLRRLLSENISLKISLAPALGRLKAVPGQLSQVIVNLAINARDAMPDGGELAITTTDFTPPAEFFRDHPDLKPGPHILLSISDTGKGMDAGTLPHIFEPFFTTKGQGLGTGLGLSIAHDIVKQHGGAIAVHSKPGTGSRFEIFLPQAEAEASSESAATPRVQSSAAGTETVLLVEDDDKLRQLSCRILQDSGYRVFAASNGDEAERRLREADGPVHLLLTDVMLPGINGRELARRLAARRPGLKLLFISGYNDDTLTQLGVLESSTQLLHKPFAAAELTAKVRQTLDLGPQPPL